MANKTYIYCGSHDMSIMKLYLTIGMLPQFEMVTLLLGHPVYLLFWCLYSKFCNCPSL